MVVVVMMMMYWRQLMCIQSSKETLEPPIVIHQLVGWNRKNPDGTEEIGTEAFDPYAPVLTLARPIHEPPGCVDMPNAVRKDMT